MNLWILKPKNGLDDKNHPWDPWYDKAFGFVVRAKTEKRARQIANDHGGSETGTISDVVYRTGGDPWLNPEYSTCTELLVDGDEEMVLRDFASA